MAGLNDLFQILGIGSRNVTGRGYSPEQWTDINKAKEERNLPQGSTGTTGPQSESASSGNQSFLSSLAGILEGAVAGARGDPYGPADQRMNQMKMAVALQTAKREAEESKLRHRILQLKAESEEQEAELRKQPFSKWMTQETESTPLPEYNPEVSPGTGPIQSGAMEEKPTGKYKLNITPETSMAVVNLLKGLLGEEAVNRQLGLGKPERVTSKEGEDIYEVIPGGGYKKVISGGLKPETGLPEYREWKKIPGNEGKDIADYLKFKASLTSEKTVYKTQPEAFAAGESARKMTTTPEAFSTLVTPAQGGFSYSTQQNPAYRKPEDAEKEKKASDRDKRAIQKDAVTLRKEFNTLKEVKDYKDVRTKIQVMEKALEKSKTTKNFVAIDQALITLFNKMTDPQSVVRESEYLRTPENIGIYNRLLGKVEKLRSGGAGLTSDEREALVSMAKEFFNVYGQYYSNAEEEFRQHEENMGLSPGSVVPKKNKSKFTIIKVE